MICEYCGTSLERRPDSGICPSCGAALPKAEAAAKFCPACGEPASQDDRFCPRCGNPLTDQKPAAPAPSVQQTVHQSVPPIPGANCCPRCYSRDITMKKRGFSILWGLVGFFFIPPFGLLFGLIGAGKLRYRCQSCHNKWERH